MTSRKPLGPIGRWFARVPRHLYRFGLGWILGKRFVMVEHTGRISGVARITVLEVIGRDAHSIDVAAAWGPESDWVRNIVAEPSVRVSSGRMRSVPATARVVDDDTATEVLAGYTKDHPGAAKALGRALDLDFSDPGAVSAQVPVVRFTFD